MLSDFKWTLAKYDRNRPTAMKILVLNSGSSSQKACLYEIGDCLPENPSVPLWEGRIEWGAESAAITARNSKGATKKNELQISSRELLQKDLLSTLWSGETRSIGSATEIDAVGHRIVHGGERFQDPVYSAGQTWWQSHSIRELASSAFDKGNRKSAGTVVFQVELAGLRTAGYFWPCTICTRRSVAASGVIRCKTISKV